MSCRVIPFLHECIFRIESRAKASDSILKMHECKNGITRQRMLYCFYPTYARFLVVSLFVPAGTCAVNLQQIGNGWEHSAKHGFSAELILPEHDDFADIVDLKKANYVVVF